jgi:ubiquinone/menaquinone biosynthesis C-methylase UbiE
MDEYANRAHTWDDDPRRTTRARVVADAIRARVPIRPGARGLEFGAGTGLLSAELRHDLGSVVLADRSDAMLDVLAEKIRAAGWTHFRPLRIDLATDPLPPARFDLVYSLMALHFVPDTDAMLGRFRELLDPGGYLCIADLDAEDGSYHTDGSDWLRSGFDRGVLRGQLEAAGFADVTIDWVFDLPKAIDGVERTYSMFLAVARRP